MAISRQDDTLYLLDAMALAYRAHFAFISRPLINSRGQNTSATYGFTGALLRLIEEHGLKHVAVVFDVMEEGGTFRDEMFADYKAHRDPPPEELLANLPSIKEVVKAMDIPVVEIGGVEADDVIGTLARRAEADGARVVIVSPDKDFQQLLSGRITMLRPAYKGDSFDPVTEAGFRDRFGLEPIQFIDVLALMGDSADNVPGVPGIGEKTATQLIQQYHTVENLLTHAAEVPGKRAREGLTDHAEMARLSKRLVTIRTDLDVRADWHDFHRANPDLVLLRQLFSRLEFNTLAERAMRILGSKAVGPPPDAAGQVDLFGPSATRDVTAPAGELVYEDPAASMPDDLARYDEETVSYVIVRTREHLVRLVADLRAKERLSFDTETTSVDALMASLVGLSFAWAPGEAAYVPTPMPDGTTTGEVLDAVRPCLESEIPKVGQNVKYDLLVLARHGLEVKGPIFDTMVAHYLVAPEEPHGLDALVSRYLKYRMISISDLIGSGRSQLSMRDVPIDQVGPYACEDADMALRLADLLAAELESEGLRSIAEDVEFPLVRVLARMELNGIRVDETVLATISQGLDEELLSLERQIHEVAGGPFNISSTQQLADLLYVRLKLPVMGKTGTGKPSTREDVLSQLATEHPLPGLILDWRELAKLKNTYVDSLGQLVHPETRRIHTSFNQTVAATGRLSSSNPNLQNIPVRTARGREIRRAFVPQAGWQILSADYAQIELRILASLAGDEAMMGAFREGTDIHTITAARVFHCTPEEVTKDQRRKAKEVNYGIPYGVSAFGLAQRLRCSRSEAQSLIDGYQQSFPRVTRFLTEQVERARERGYAETMLGRRRFVPDITAKNRVVRDAAERVSLNMPIQGTQADMIKIAMIRIDERLRAEKLRARMLLQVHDELVFEVPPEEVDRLRVLVRAEMEGALPLGIPVEVGLDTGDNWLDAH